MRIDVDFNGYDRLLQPTEWRFSAATVGLVKYLDFHHLQYTTLAECSEKLPKAVKGFDGVLYHSEDINKERYLKFVESYFKADMTHITILKLLEADEFDEETIKRVNELAGSKTVLKTVFEKVKFDGKNKDYFISRIEEKRLDIIESIFKYGKNLYSNYCNPNLFLSNDNPHCRLQGYTVDEGRKTRFLGFCFSKDSYCGHDISEFDFIPFAFSNSDMYETFFINNNFTVRTLIKTDEWIRNQLSNSDKKDSRERLFTVLKNAKDFIDFDVEIITKSRNDELYKTLFVRYQNLKYLKSIGDRKINFIHKITDDYYFNLERTVYEYCLNNLLLDELIVKMLKIYFYKSKEKSDKEIDQELVRFRTNMLIDINVSWKGNKNMNEVQNARKVGFLVSKKLIETGRKNKINSYRQKITSALVAHDYDRVKEILLSLSSYVDIEFGFFYTFLENAEENKDIVFSFTSALTENINNKQKGDN